MADASVTADAIARVGAGRALQQEISELYPRAWETQYRFIMALEGSGYRPKLLVTSAETIRQICTLMSRSNGEIMGWDLCLLTDLPTGLLHSVEGIQLVS